MPRISRVFVPATPVIALIDSSSHDTIGPIAINSFKKYLGNDQVCNPKMLQNDLIPVMNKHEFNRRKIFQCLFMNERFPTFLLGQRCNMLLAHFVCTETRNMISLHPQNNAAMSRDPDCLVTVLVYGKVTIHTSLFTCLLSAQHDLYRDANPYRLPRATNINHAGL